MQRLSSSQQQSDEPRVEPGQQMTRVLHNVRMFKRLKTKVERYGVETLEETFRRWQTIRMPNLPLRVRDYDPGWARLFEREKKRLAKALGTLASDIQHFGSTSVPGMPSKNIIDLFVVVQDPSAGQVEEILVTLGYEPYGNSPLDPDTSWFWRAEEQRCAFATHVCDGQRAWLRTAINLRDYLRVHPEERVRYAELKHRLAAEKNQDFLRYSLGKIALCNELNEMADAWRATAGTVGSHEPSP